MNRNDSEVLVLEHTLAPPNKKAYFDGICLILVMEKLHFDDDLDLASIKTVTKTPN
jgi:hypothetical protein